MEDKTTVVELNIEPMELYEVIQSWAAETNFSLYEKNEKRTIYTKNIRLNTAWLSIETLGKNAKLNAWLGSKSLGPDGKGNAWKGWRIDIPSGFTFGPAAVYKKNFNKLTQTLENKSKNISYSTSPANQSIINRDAFAKGLAVLGVIIFLGGAISLFSVATLFTTSAFQDLAKTSLQKGLFEGFIGIITFICSRLLKNGKVLAIWVYGGIIFLSTGYNVIMGYKFPYFTIILGTWVMIQLLKLRKHGELV